MYDNNSEEDYSRIFGMFRAYIMHEDTLINNRLMWMLTIHGFLYATYGFTLQKLLEIVEKIAAVMKSNPMGYRCEFKKSVLFMPLLECFLFLIIICVVGFIISLFARISIIAASKAVSALVSIFHTQFPIIEVSTIFNRKDVRIWNAHPDRQYFFPSLTGGGDLTGERDGFRAAKIIPTTLLISWMVASISLIVLGSKERHILLPDPKICVTYNESKFMKN